MSTSRYDSAISADEVGQRLLRGLLRLGEVACLWPVVLAAALWGTLALWFALPAAAGARLVVAALFAGAGIGGLMMALRRRRILLPLLPFTVGLMVLLVCSGGHIVQHRCGAISRHPDAALTGLGGCSRLLVPGAFPRRRESQPPRLA